MFTCHSEAVWICLHMFFSTNPGCGFLFKRAHAETKPQANLLHEDQEPKAGYLREKKITSKGNKLRFRLRLGCVGGSGISD